MVCGLDDPESNAVARCDVDVDGGTADEPEGMGQRDGGRCDGISAIGFGLRRHVQS